MPSSPNESRTPRGPAPRARKPLIAGLLVIGAVALATLPHTALARAVLAQIGPPIRLFPAPLSPPPAPPAAPAPAPPAGTPAGEPASPRTPPGGDTIKIVPLAPADSAWSGSLALSEGAFPATLWERTQRSLVLAALPLIEPTTSPTLQDLARRLLLSAGTAPAGSDPPDKPGLLALRLDRLLALGLVDGAASLLDPDRGGTAAGADEPADRRRIELRFLRNDDGGACDLSAAAVAQRQGPWWDRAVIACQALAGDAAKAALGLSLLREAKDQAGRSSSEPGDAAFETLVGILAGRPATLAALPAPTPMLLALLAAAKLPLPADALAAASPALLRQWAMDERVPAEERLAAAERSAALGALPLDRLRALYESLALPPELPAPAAGEDARNPRGRALLYLAAGTAVTPVEKAKALQALLTEGRQRGALVLTARLAAPLLLTLRPATELQWFAADAARALYAALRPIEARAWYNAAPPEAQRALLPLARLAQGRDAPDAGETGLGDGEGDAEVAASRAGLVLVLLGALDERVSAAEVAPWLAAAPAAPRPVPSPAAWAAARQAAADRRLGETVMLTLIIARAGDRLTTDPIVLARAVAGLRSVGLDRDARALAIEAAIAAGL